VTAAKGWHKESFELLDFREPLWRRPLDRRSAPRRVDLRCERLKRYHWYQSRRIDPGTSQLGPRQDCDRRPISRLSSNRLMDLPLRTGQCAKSVLLLRSKQDSLHLYLRESGLHNAPHIESRILLSPTRPGLQWQRPKLKKRTARVEILDKCHTHGSVGRTRGEDDRNS
jgi:hypothetical protein